MIHEENLNELYKNIVEGIELTTKKLNALGFNSRDLKDLIERGSMIRVQRGVYALKSVDELFYYGKQLIAKNQHDKATQCFERCFQIDPTHTGVCFQLFLRCIQNRDYKKAFDYFNVFYPGKNEFYNADSRFYLYMLSMITELPENYRECVKNLKLEDFRVDYKDKRFGDIPLQNKIRISAFNQRFVLAIRQLYEFINKEGKLSVQDIIMKVLLHQALEVQTQNRKTVMDLIRRNKYQEVIEFYERLPYAYRFSISDRYTLILTRELLHIIDSKKVPQIRVYSTENLFEAIDGKNFELALSLALVKNQKYGTDHNAIYLLLNEIVQRSKELKNNTSQEKMTLSSKETVKPVEPQTIVTHSPMSSSVTFADVIRFLMINDLDNSFRTLRTYLKNINKSEYEFLIVDLIKISLLEKDLAFTKPMTALTLISRENYIFDISGYIQEFYINLSQNKLEEARLYLDIISKGNQLGQDCVITDGLYQVLETSEKMLDDKKNNTILTSVDEALEHSEISQPLCTPKPAGYTELEEQASRQFVDPSAIQTVHLLQPQQKTKEIPPEKINSEKAFMDKKYKKLLKRKSMILLDPMESAEIDRILEMIEDYPDMVAFIVEVGRKQQVVLRYKPVGEYIDVKSVINLGNQAYNDGNYKECIENYLKLLQNLNEPKSNIYSKLGLAYLKNRQKPLAIEYLTVANALVKKEKLSFDYSDLIAELKGEIQRVKPQFKMTLKDFDYSGVDPHYGIKNFTQINSYIAESGLDVESACEQLGLTSEETDMVKLIYAKEFYTQGFEEQGDLFFRSFERSKHKTEATKKVFEEIRKNKRFYKNRQGDNPTELVLSLVPKKNKVSN